MSKPIRKGDTVRVGFGTGIDGHIAEVEYVNDLAATARVRYKRYKTKEVSITKLEHLQKENVVTEYARYITLDGENAAWKKLARDGKNVDAIRKFRECYGAPLKEAKDVVEQYKDLWQKGKADERIVTVGESTIHITRTHAGDFRVEVKSVLGFFEEAELFQVIANTTKTLVSAGPRG